MADLPLDTAWRRFLRLDKGQPPAPLEITLRALEGVTGQYNLDPTAVTLAADIAGLSEVEGDERIALVLMVLAALVDLQQGSTRTPAAEHLEGRARDLLRAARPDLSADRVEAHVIALRRLLNAAREPSGVIGRAADARRPLLHLDGFIYLQRLFHAEAALAERLRLRLARPADTFPLEHHLADVLKRAALRGGTPVALSEEQVGAVRTAMTRSITFVSGGPGTGKTSIVVAMLRVLTRLGVAPEEIALAAPTGKAAWRMGESIQGSLAAIDDPSDADAALYQRMPEPRTLHRLLGYSPTADRFRHDADNPLAARALVVDEGSMVDVFMMERLLAAVSATCRLVILGDQDQLPSVAAGAVFRDAIAIAGGARARLTYSYRMRADDPAGRGVLMVAQRIRDGRADLFGQAEDGTPLVRTRPRPELIEGEGVELLPVDRPGLRLFLDAWYATHVARPPSLEPLVTGTWHMDVDGIVKEETEALTSLFAHLERSRILCLTRGYDTGALRANSHLHERVARDAGQPAAINFLIGEPVMVLHNDYARLLFNGDQGVVLRVEDGDGRRRMAVFPRAGGGFRAFPLDALGGQLELAYAMTVHKSQGSEYDAVAVFLPEDDLPLLTRELLYTGVTRSKRSVIIVGSAELLTTGVHRGVVRFSGLAERAG